MELTPLRRASSGAVLGGVCAGLARRWQVDPTVLRIAIVLLALLGGLGVAFYVGALLLIPKDGSTDFPLYSVAPFTRSWSPAAAIGAVVGLGVLITLAIGSWLPFGVAPAVGLGFLWYFGFHRRRQPQQPDATGAGQPSQLPPSTPSPEAASNALPRPTAEAKSDFERAAAAWRERVAEERLGTDLSPYPPSPLNDPYPTQQFATYQPTPPPAEPAVPDWTPPARPTGRSRGPKWLWPLVLCLLGGGLAVLAVLSVVLGVVVPPVAYAGTVLGALAVGLLLAAFTGRPRALLPLSVIAALVTIAMLLPVPRVDGRMGDETYTYSTVAQLPTSPQSHGAGNVVVDLAAVAVTESRRVEFSNGLGDVDVKLPATGNVVVEWRLGAGQYQGPDGERDGVGLSGTYQRINDPNAPTLTVVLNAGAGNLTVTE